MSRIRHKSRLLSGLGLGFFGAAFGICTNASDINMISNSSDGTKKVIAASETLKPGLQWQRFSGTALPGSAVHDWIESITPRPLPYPVSYDITIAGHLLETAQNGPESFALQMLSSSNFANVNTAKKDGHLSKQSLDPASLIPDPGQDGSPGQYRNGCWNGMIGFPPQYGTIEYEWRWLQSDTNNDDVIDENDEWGWVLVAFTVVFQADVSSISPC